MWKRSRIFWICSSRLAEDLDAGLKRLENIKRESDILGSFSQIKEAVKLTGKRISLTASFNIFKESQLSIRYFSLMARTCAIACSPGAPMVFRFSTQVFMEIAS